MLKKYSKYFVSLFAKGSPFYLASEIAKDSFKIKNKVYSNEAHIRAAIGCLLEAQKANSDGGVAALYSFYEGWHASYSETTGYIIPTMFNYYHKTNDISIKKSALRMADWELAKQLGNGAFPGGATDNKEFPIVFNTGQVIFGIARAYKETKKMKYKKSLERAADWLVKIQNKNGCWDRFDYLGKVHTYNTRTAWSLLHAYEVIKKKSYVDAVRKNIDWSLSQQLGNGWFNRNAFYEKQEPLLHTIAYTIQGILECGIFFGNKNYIESAKKSADALITLQRKDGSLAGSFDKGWKSSVSWSCLTGNSQMAIVWLRLYGMTNDEKYLNAAKKINNYVKSTQNIKSRNKNIKGGIKGAYPIYGWYAPFCYINWAAKFFVDALMMEEDLKIGDYLG